MKIVMTYTTSKNLLLSTVMMAFVITLTTNVAYASHDSWTSGWSEPEQEFYCDSSLSNISVTTTVTETHCEIIADAAEDWTDVANSDWALTESQSPAIDFKGANLASQGLVGKMTPYGIGILYAAKVELNTEEDFGDADTDSNVYDIYTLWKHEMGHLPVLNHNRPFA